MNSPTAADAPSSNCCNKVALMGIRGFPQARSRSHLVSQTTEGLEELPGGVRVADGGLPVDSEDEREVERIAPCVRTSSS